MLCIIHIDFNTDAVKSRDSEKRKKNHYICVGQRNEKMKIATAQQQYNERVKKKSETLTQTPQMLCIRNIEFIQNQFSIKWISFGWIQTQYLIQ